jgi:hypothetical protein
VGLSGPYRAGLINFVSGRAAWRAGVAAHARAQWLAGRVVLGSGQIVCLWAGRRAAGQMAIYRV